MNTERFPGTLDSVFQNTASSLPPKTQSCKTCSRNINTHSHLTGLFSPVRYKLALTKSIANEWTTKAFAICLYGDWTPYCCPSTPPEGAQGGVRHSVLQGIWWDSSFSPVQSLIHVRLFATPWTAAHQASLSAGVQPQLIQGIRRGDGFGDLI